MSAPTRSTAAGALLFGEGDDHKVTPAKFITEYVEPAIAHWREEPTSTLKAIGAISQVDILAEVVATHQNGGTLPRGGAGSFRDDLGRREPALARVRDAHDSHKHGELSRRSAQDITGGQRPYRHRGTAIFSNANFMGTGFFGKPSAAILLDDGTQVPVGQLLTDAMAAWDRELARLGISR